MYRTLYIIHDIELVLLHIYIIHDIELVLLHIYIIHDIELVLLYNIYIYIASIGTLIHKSRLLANKDDNINGISTTTTTNTHS